LIPAAPAYEAEMLTVGPKCSVLHVGGNQKTSVFTCTCTLAKEQDVSFGGECLSAKPLGVTSHKTTIFKRFLDFKNALDVSVGV
jgi:hypothetical protein